MGSRSLRKIILVFLYCLLIPWPVEAEDKEIELQYKPREKVNVHTKHVPAVKIYFEEVKDPRSRPKEIGENQEDKDKKIQIVTPDGHGAGRFVLSVLKSEFRDKGFKVEDRSDEAQKIISTTLLKFWTMEERRYNSEIQIRVELRDNNGQVSFKKTYSGAGINSGRSLSEVNYNESFSDAISRMMEKLFSDLEFLKVLSEKPKPPRVEEKPVEERKAEQKKLEEKKAEEKRTEGKKREEEKQIREKKLEELRLELRRLEESRLEEKRVGERRVREKKLREKRLELKRLEEKRVKEKKAEERRRAREKKLEEKRLELKRIEEKKIEEKRLEEKKAEEKRSELKRSKEKKLEGKKAEEKRQKEQKQVKGKKEERKRVNDSPAKEKQDPPSAEPEPVDPFFGPK